MNRGKLIIFASLVLVLFAGFLGFQHFRSQAELTAQNTVVPRTMAIPRGSIVRTMAASGTIAGAHQANLSFALNGQVQQVLVNKGDFVQKGQVLARMDSSQQELALLKAQNALELAKIESAVASRKERELDLEIAAVNLAKTQILAPFSGLVVELALEEGESFQANTTAITLLDNSSFFVNVTVDELDVGLLNLGQKAMVTVDALENILFEGLVSDIGWLAQTTGGLVTVPVSIQILDNDESLRVGYSASVEIEIARVDNVLKLPLEAVLRRGNQASVTVWRNGIGTSVAVRTGLTDGQEVEIISGLHEDDQVVGFNFGAYGQGNLNETVGAAGPGNFGGFNLQQLQRSGGFGR